MKLAALLFFSFFAVAAKAGTATAVSADDAQTAWSQGAFVVDVRGAQQFDAGRLPLAVALPTNAAELPLQDLSGLLANAGVDSSRTILIVGEAGDANAQALWQRLAQVTSGRVLWLVGGVQEWQMRGYSLSKQTLARPSVPQFLVSFDATEKNDQAVRMAGSKVRTSPLLERNLPVRLALN